MVIANVNTNFNNTNQSGFDKNSREMQRSQGDTAELLEAAENLERENQVFIYFLRDF